jgi:hypothetical protein
MYTLQENEKTTPVVAYTENSFIYGDLVTTKVVRVNIWLRTDSAPKYLHLLHAQVSRMSGSVKTLKFEEIFFPVNDLIGFHLAPGVESPLDYEEGEANRRMLPVQALVGAFTIRASARISTQTEFKTALEVSRSSWFSLYDATISSPYLPQMKMQVPMLIVRPEHAAFSLME